MYIYIGRGSDAMLGGTGTLATFQFLGGTICTIEHEEVDLALLPLEEVKIGNQC